jgi:hypothetical protein
VSKPEDYGSHVDVIGNVFPPLMDNEKDLGNFRPPEGLLDWLAESTTLPIFVGFGSMVIKVLIPLFFVCGCVKCTEHTHYKIHCTHSFSCSLVIRRHFTSPSSSSSSFLKYIFLYCSLINICVFI